jgi:RHS repeat-associated protein
VKKTVGSEITRFHYDYNGNLISETDGTGSPVRDYIYLNGEPAAMKLYGTGAGWYYFINDHLGTPQKVTDASGAVVWEAGYMPFGEARILIADIENNLRFPGQYYDKETGLHYNYHRYYDPETGRYLTPDPIGLEGGLNLYAYVDGNPVNWADPNGLMPSFDKNLDGIVDEDSDIADTCENFLPTTITPLITSKDLILMATPLLLGMPPIPPKGPFKGLNPDIKVKELLKGSGQIPALLRNKNLRGVDTQGLLSKTLREVKELLNKKQFKTFMKHFEGRDLRHGK